MTWIVPMVGICHVLVAVVMAVPKTPEADVFKEVGFVEETCKRVSRVLLTEERIVEEIVKGEGAAAAKVERVPLPLAAGKGVKLLEEPVEVKVEVAGT